MMVYVCPREPNASQIAHVAKSIKATAETYVVDDVMVVFPETCVNWTVEGEESEGQRALIELSTSSQAMILLGAWFPTAGEGYRNAVVVLENGTVAAVVDKMHQVPFVESRPVGTALLKKLGWIPTAAIRDVAPTQRLEIDAWKRGKLAVSLGVCYDIFFGGTFRRFPARTVGLSVCCLDESFDSTGVFRKLSSLHARLRAVEFRQPMVRSSLGGRSGVTDPDGSQLDPVEVTEAYSVYLVRPRFTETVYERWGDWFPLLCCGVGIVAASITLTRACAVWGNGR
ncbi:MAG: hypothetical protein KatS3mg111_3629 [Pirellulaceae bacterium]|nr:MAG: hypothetical protein KatS3mg111_3629 [Pirellulaceae bacterium]